MPGAPGTGGGVYGEAASTFAGFTTATQIGSTAGGREKMHALCGAQFAGSHLCHMGEYGGANSATPVPAAGAWIDTSGGVEMYNANVNALLDLSSAFTGRYVGQLTSLNCDNWTTANDGNTTSGAMITPAGYQSAVCTTSHQLACCSTPYLEKFAGFTTATTSGVAGGRAAMHALCGAQFAGSHMCHNAEYARANTATSPPAGGAWIDASGYLRTAGGTAVVTEVETVYMGRYLGQLTSLNCDNWTSANDGNTTSGELITASGYASALCTTSHPVACCK